MKTHRHLSGIPVLVLGVVLVTLAGAACTSQQAVELPDSPPSIAGTITQVDPAGEQRGTIRVEEVPDEPAGSDKAIVKIGPDTELLDTTGRRITFAQLEVGRKVRAWFSGPVAESWPVQANASTVILEPAGK